MPGTVLGTSISMAQHRLTTEGYTLSYQGRSEHPAAQRHRVTLLLKCSRQSFAQTTGEGVVGQHARKLCSTARHRPWHYLQVRDRLIKICQPALPPPPPPPNFLVRVYWHALCSSVRTPHSFVRHGRRARGHEHVRMLAAALATGRTAACRPSGWTISRRCRHAWHSQTKA